MLISDHAEFKEIEAQEKPRLALLGESRMPQRLGQWGEAQRMLRP
jgi:hypothetical protein